MSSVNNNGQGFQENSSTSVGANQPQSEETVLTNHSQIAPQPPSHHNVQLQLPWQMPQRFQQLHEFLPQIPASSTNTQDPYQILGALTSLMIPRQTANHVPESGARTSFPLVQQQAVQQQQQQQQPQISNVLLQSLARLTGGAAGFPVISNDSSSNFAAPSHAPGYSSQTAWATAQGQSQGDSQVGSTNITESTLQRLLGSNNSISESSTETVQQLPVQIQQLLGGLGAQPGLANTNNRHNSAENSHDFLQLVLASFLQSKQSAPAHAQLPPSQPRRQSEEEQEQLQQKLLQQLQVLANRGQLSPIDTSLLAGLGFAHAPQWSATAAPNNFVNFGSDSNMTINMPSQNQTAAAAPIVAAGQHKTQSDPETECLLASIPPMPAELEAMKKRKPRGRSSTFPRKLLQMLTELEQQPGGSAIASWLAHGKS